MCGRYLFYDEKNEKIRRLIHLAETTLDPAVFQTVAIHEVRPSDHAFIGVYDPKKQNFHTTIMKWGWPLGAKLVINTRVETYQTSKFYRDALPCAVLCSGYYEWSKDHHKYYFSLADEAMYLASLYHMENNVPVFTIMTEPAVGRQLEIHNRQPIVLPYEKAQAWCASRNIPVQSYSLPDRICSEVSE